MCFFNDKKVLYSVISNMSNPIPIPRNLNSSKPPQDPPMFSPTSFDEFCGHFKNAHCLKSKWKKHVSSYKEVSVMEKKAAEANHEPKPDLVVDTRDHEVCIPSFTVGSLE